MFVKSKDEILGEIKNLEIKLVSIDSLYAQATTSLETAKAAVITTKMTSAGLSPSEVLRFKERLQNALKEVLDIQSKRGEIQSELNGLHTELLFF
jgi:predicted  nucleic acid-binding Zn-ribbon protein